MLTMFKVLVSLHANDKGALWCNKDIIEQEVQTVTDKWVTFVETGQKVRVPRSRCFSTKEEAERECDSLANELIARLNGEIIKALKEPATVRESASLHFKRQQNEQE